jgi:hypothetical protein
MKSSHYFAIAVRLFAVVLFLYGLKQSTGLFIVLLTGSFNGADVPAIHFFVTSAAPLIVSAFLWFFPLTVSTHIVGSDLDLAVQPMATQSVLVVLVLGIGLFAFYNALMDAIYWTLAVNMSGNEEEPAASLHLTVEDRASIWVTGIEVVVSLAIIGKARSIAKRMSEFAK